MPQPKDVAKYPREFLEIADRFVANTSPFNIQFLTAREAIRTRFRLYGFKDALINDPGVGQSPFTNFLATEIGLQQFKDGRAQLIIRMPEDSPELQSVREALSGAALGADQALASSPAQEEGGPAPAVGADGSAVDASVEAFLNSEDTERRKEPRDD